MPTDYIVLIAIGVIGVGGGIYLLRQAKKLRVQKDQKATRYDIADHLRTPEEMAMYLAACTEESDGDAAFIGKALGDIARAQDRQYTYRVTWSQEDAEYVGLCAEFPSLSWLAPTPEKALAGIHQLVAEVVADMRPTGEHAQKEWRPWH